MLPGEIPEGGLVSEPCETGSAAGGARAETTGDVLTGAAEYAARFARRYGVSPDDAYSEGLIAAWRAAESHNPSRRSLRWWTRYKARLAVMEAGRAEARGRVQRLGSATFDVAEQRGEDWETNAEEARLAYSLARVLRVDARSRSRVPVSAALLLVSVYGLSKSEAARRLGWSDSAVSHRLETIRGRFDGPGLSRALGSQR